MKFKLKKSGSQRKVDMTPMIDCVFQLLLFFLVASNFQAQARISGEGELGANLPAVAAAMPMAETPCDIAAGLSKTRPSRTCGRCI